MRDRHTSTVARYLDFRGFGFIRNPGVKINEDIFVSGRDIPVRMGIGKRLLKDELVEFEIEETSRGAEAVKLSFPKTTK